MDGKVINQMTIEAEGLDDVINGIAESAGKAGKQLQEMASKSMVFDAAIKAMGQLRDMVGGLAAPFNSFETAMRGANTMAGKSGKDFDDLSDHITQLSKNIPLAREELAGGLYQVISNGVPEDNWIAFLEQSSKSAVGGIADLGQTVTVTSTLIKNYGLTWDQAATIQDKIQTTAKNGVTSFEQLGAALPRVSGTAAQLGVTMDEMMAVFATTTGVTGNTSEVATQLSAVLSSLVKPSAEATKAAEAMGIGFNASSVKAAGGLENFLLGLDASVNEYASKTGQLKETIYGQLFGSAEAMRMLGSLTGEQKDKFSENIGAMADSAGAIDDAFNEMAGTGESATQMFQNQAQAVMDWAGSIASSAAPYVDMIANTGSAVMSVQQLGGMLKNLVAGMDLARVATLAQAAAAKVVVVASNAWKMAQAALNVVLSANPIGLVVMAIGALVAGIVYAYNHCETFRNICDQVWAVVKKLAAAVWDFLVKAFENVSTVVRKAWEWVKNFFGIKDENTAKQTADLVKNSKAIEQNTKAKEENAKVKTGNAVAALQANKANNSPTATTTTKKEEDKLDGSQLVKNASTYKELGNNIQYYQKKLEGTKATETETIALYAKKVAALKQQQNALQTAFERSARVGVETGKITTYNQLEDELSYYTDLLRDSTETERTEIQKQINALNDLKKKWDEALAAMKRPPEIGQLNTIGELDESISYYQARQKTATADELMEIESTINALDRKRNAMKSLASVADLQDEVEQLNGLNGQQLKLELDLIGLDGVKRKIKQLQDMLADTKNPMSEAQRQDVANLIDTYRQYEKQLQKNSVTFEKSWGSVKGVGNGIRGMTDALEGNGNAWDRITGAVDSAIQVYQGMQGIVKLVQTLTAVTEAQTLATQAQGVAKTVTAATDTTATATEVANSAMRATASGVETTADVAGAAAKTMKAHASIPFVGIAIGAGLVGALIGMMASLPKFADGGIAYGPTLGLFGEYAGASHNPEVVAPLDKLKSLIGGGDGGYGGGRVVGRLKGRDLELVLANETRTNRRRSNIRI